MIRSFKDKGTREIFDGISSKTSRKTLPSHLHDKAGQLLDRLNSAVSLKPLRLPGLRLEQLRGDRKGQYSIRINDQYRVCFRWEDDSAWDVEIVDDH